MQNDNGPNGSSKKPAFDVMIAQPRPARAGQEQKSDFFHIATVFESDRSKEGNRTFSGPSMFGGRIVIKERQPKIVDDQAEGRDRKRNQDGPSMS